MKTFRKHYLCVCVCACAWVCYLLIGIGKYYKYLWIKKIDWIQDFFFRIYLLYCSCIVHRSFEWVLMCACVRICILWIWELFYRVVDDNNNLNKAIRRFDPKRNKERIYILCKENWMEKLQLNCEETKQNQPNSDCFCWRANFYLSIGSIIRFYFDIPVNMPTRIDDSVQLIECYIFLSFLKRLHNLIIIEWMRIA